MMGVRPQGGNAAGSAVLQRPATGGRWSGVLAVAVAWVCAASAAQALTLSGGPVYSLPGGGSCAVTNVHSRNTGATVSCTGVNLGAHTNVYFGIKNNSNVNGLAMDGSGPSGTEIFSFVSAGGSSITYSSAGFVTSLITAPTALGTDPVSNTLTIALSSGSASVVATAGNPASNGNGAIERVFKLNSGSTFNFDVDITSSDPHFSGQACTSVYDPTHVTSGAGLTCLGRVDLGFYYSDCGDGVVDSPEQCDEGGANGSPTSCCTSSCTFRSAGQNCRAGAGAPCDLTEQCTGSNAECPPDDVFTTLGNVCRTGSGDLCDQNETCTGVPGEGCPADDAPGNTVVVCRVGSVGDFCDQNEMCTGVPGATCPADDAPGKINVICRAGSGDICDPEERCTGVPGQGCPAQIVAPPTTVCRVGSGDICDPNETCTAVPGQPCPANVVAPPSTVCRAAAGVCDVADQCTGVAGQQCSADAKQPASTPCNVDNDVCTVDACNGSGACVFGSALSCADGNACTQDSCDPQDGCEYTGAPALTCASASKAVLKVRDNASVNSGDSVKFLWKGGPSLVPDMGDPTQTTSYELCIYDSTGVQLAMGVPPGAGWTTLGAPSSPKGYKFKDSAGTNDGVTQIKTKGSNLDKAQVKVIAKGENVPDTGVLPFQYPVTAQVYASDGMCWEAEFNAPQTKKNELGKYGAKLP